MYSVEDSENILVLDSEGSYSWDSDDLTLTMETTSTLFYDLSDLTLTTVTAENSTEDFYFDDSYHDVLFKKSANDNTVWTYNEKIEYNGENFSSTDQYTFEYSKLIIEHSSSTTDIFGTTTDSSQNKREYRIIDLFPAGTEWAEGNTVTFYLELESYQTRSWDSETSSWNDWTDGTESSFRKSLTMTHAGDFIIFSSADSTRGISGGLYE